MTREELERAYGILLRPEDHGTGDGRLNGTWWSALHRARHGLYLLLRKNREEPGLGEAMERGLAEQVDRPDHGP